MSTVPVPSSLTFISNYPSGEMARVGGEYQGPPNAMQPVIVWLNRQPAKGVTPLPTDQRRQALTDVPVRLTHQLAADNEQEVKSQSKLQPDPLSEWLALRSLDGAVASWLKGRGTWRGIDWDREALRTQIGWVDYPAQAQLFRLWLNFASGH